LRSLLLFYLQHYWKLWLVVTNQIQNEVFYTVPK